MKALALVASCCFASTAHADPAWTVEAGGQVGGTGVASGPGGALGAAQRLYESGTGSVWAHESFSATSLLGPFLFGHGTGAAFRGSAGLEFRAATSPGGSTYFLFGLEGGYEQIDYEGVNEGFFGGSTDVSQHERGPVGVVRLGAHFGGPSVGIEPVLELAPRPGLATHGQFDLMLVFGW